MKKKGTDVFDGLDAEAILTAAESCGVRSTGRVVQLNSMENRVHAVEMDDGHVVVKFYRPGRWTKEMLLGEHALALLLQEENISTPRYREILDPALRVDPRAVFSEVFAPHIAWQGYNAGTLGKLGDFHFCVWEKVSGRAPLEMDTEDLRRAGRLVARMHNLFESGIRREAFPRPSLSTETYLLDALSYLEAWGRIPRTLESLLFDAAENLLEGLRWMDDCMDFIPVHGDLHRLNLIQTKDGGDFWVVDFDDSVLGAEIQDLWLLASGCDISSHVPEGSNRTSLDFLVEGYNTLRKLPSGSERLVEPLRTLRMIHYMGWIARRWDHDKLFRSTFSFFTTERYWEEALQDVEKQKELLEAEGLLQY